MGSKASRFPRGFDAPPATEAAASQESYDVTAYLLDLTFDDAAETVDGSVQVTIESTRTVTERLDARLECHGSSAAGATVGEDFGTQYTPFFFTAGTDVATAEVTILQDAEVEGDEVFTCYPARDRDYETGTPNSVVITILDDD